MARFDLIDIVSIAAIALSVGAMCIILFAI
jgi:hypothetical protein